MNPYPHMKLHPKRKCLETVYVMGYGKGTIIERRADCENFLTLYKVKLDDGTIIGQVQERHFMEYADFEIEEPVRSIPRLVKG